MIVAIAGMTAAAIPYLAPMPTAFNAYAALAVLPTAGRLFVTGSAREATLGALMLIYLAGLLRSAYVFRQWLSQAERLAFEQAAKARELNTLTRDLAAAQAQTQAETALRLQIERNRRDLEAQTHVDLARLVDERTTVLQATVAAMTAAREQRDAALVAGRLALFEVDVTTRVVELSVHWSQMLGGPATATTTTMQALLLLTHPNDRPAIGRAYRDAVRGKSPRYVIDHRVQAQHGGWLWVESRARVTARRPNGMTARMVGTNCDITTRKENQTRLLYQAYRDPLTGLGNRAFLRERLQEMIYRAERLQHLFAVLCLDLDHFKVINDANGHAAGDQLRRAAAALLAQAVRQGDIVVRLGGDEFAVLLEGPLTSADMAAVARKRPGPHQRPDHPRRPHPCVVRKYRHQRLSGSTSPSSR